MIGPFVADASVAVAWIHPAQATEATRGMLQSIREGAVVHVPALWPLEIANVLLVLTRRGKLLDRDRRAALGWIQRLPVEVDHEMASMAYGRLSDLACEYTLSVYDATYLELAQRLNLPLGCKDGALRVAAQACGVSAWQ
jgi:predicted nucleic acid-binding protein